MVRRTGRRVCPLPPIGAAVPVAWELRRYKERSGKTYDELAVIAQYTKTALSVAASGKKLPSWGVVDAFVRACGGTEFDVADMKVIWEKARADSQVRSGRQRAGNGRPAQAEERVLTYFTADPRQITHRDGFNVALEQIRVELDLSVNEIIERSKLPGRDGIGLQLRRTHVYDVLSGRARPSELFVELFLVACGMPKRQRRIWLQQLEKLKEEERRASEALAVLQKRSRGDGTGRALEALSRLQTAPQETSVYSAMRSVQLDLEPSTQTTEVEDAEIIDDVVEAEIVDEDEAVETEIVGGSCGPRGTRVNRVTSSCTDLTPKPARSCTDLTPKPARSCTDTVEIVGASCARRDRVNRVTPRSARSCTDTVKIPGGPNAVPKVMETLLANDTLASGSITLLATLIDLLGSRRRD